MRTSEQDPQLRYTPKQATTALQAARRDVHVPAGETREIGPDAEESGCFHLVHVETYADLQALDLVPRGLDRDRVTEAIRADDADAHRQALATTTCREHADCGCGTATADATSPLRATYDALRPRQNPQLAAVLGEHYSQPIAWDDLLPRIVRRWHDRLVASSPLFLGVLGLNDIVIEDHATLHVAKTVQVLSAANISIGREGRLDLKGGGAKVRCLSVNGPSLFKSRLTELAAQVAVNRHLEVQS